MKVVKVINNNVVSSVDDKNNEIIVMGRGIGFKKQSGEDVEEEKIEKVFLLSNSSKTNQFMKLVQKIPYEHIKTANEIIVYARSYINKKLSDNIYIALTDHLNFAIERKEKGLEFKNALLWEIKHFYNHEFLIGKEALTIIKRKLGVELPEDEAGFIAMHIVNAELDTDMQHSLIMTKMIKNIFNIVQYHFNIVIDENTLSYERFITHLKFFIQRAVSNCYYATDDFAFCNLIQNQYKEAYSCAVKVKDYMKTKIDYELTEEEIIYLTIHIKRVADEHMKV